MKTINKEELGKIVCWDLSQYDDAHEFELIEENNELTLHLNYNSVFPDFEDYKKAAEAYALERSTTTWKSDSKPCFQSWVAQITNTQIHVTFHCKHKNITCAKVSTPFELKVMVDISINSMDN